MLTPQEVAEHVFSKASFGGYNMAMVDEFLDQVTADYTTLYKENTTLKAKMKVLADKIEEYRSTEEAMRKTILSAQRMADQMVAEAEEKKNTIVHDAEEEAQDKIRAIRQEVESEELRLTAAQNATTAYIAKLKELYQHEMEYIGGLSKLVAAARQPDPVTAAAEEIGSAVEKAMQEALPQEEPQSAEETQVPLEQLSIYEELKRGPMVHAEEDTQPMPAPRKAPADEEEEDEDDDDDDDDDEEDDSPTRRIDFSNLQFGKDYEIE